MQIFGTEVQVPLQLSQDDLARIRKGMEEKAIEKLSDEYVDNVSQEIFKGIDRQAFVKAVSTAVTGRLNEKLEKVVEEMVDRCLDDVLRRSDRY